MQEKLGFICGRHLVECKKRDARIWVLDGDLADSDGAEPFMLAHPEHFIAAGIAEQNMISVAAGLASTNLRPWVFSFAAFLCYRAYDQIRVCISQTKLPVTLVGSHAGACGGRNGKSHVAINDIAVMASLPNIEIWTPVDENDTRFAVNQILQNNKPAYLRLPRDPQANVLSTSSEIQWIGQQSRSAIFSFGLSTQWALRVQKKLAQDGLDIGVLHFCKLWPLDRAYLQTFLVGVKKIWVLEDHYAFGGLRTCLQEAGINVPINTFSWRSQWSGQSGSAEELLQSNHLTADHVCEVIKNQRED